jgi:hypothetical protein
MVALGKLLLKVAAAAPAVVGMLSGVALAVSYHVPESNFWLSACRKAALQRHPGEVERVSTRVSGATTYIKLTIEQADGRELIVVCDGPKGKILRTIAVDEE